MGRDPNMRILMVSSEAAPYAKTGGLSDVLGALPAALRRVGCETMVLLPLYAQNLLPKTVVSRPIHGAPPMVDLVIGYNEANTSPLLKFLLSKVDELKFRVSKN